MHFVKFFVKLHILYLFFIILYFIPYLNCYHFAEIIISAIKILVNSCFNGNYFFKNYLYFKSIHFYFIIHFKKNSLLIMIISLFSFKILLCLSVRTMVHLNLFFHFLNLIKIIQFQIQLFIIFIYSMVNSIICFFLYMVVTITLFLIIFSGNFQMLAWIIFIKLQKIILVNQLLYMYFMFINLIVNLINYYFMISTFLHYIMIIFYFLTIALSYRQIYHFFHLLFWKLICFFDIFIFSISYSHQHFFKFFIKFMICPISNFKFLRYLNFFYY